MKPEDRLEPPEYELDSALRKTLIVKAGTLVSIEVPVRGRPTPNVTWTKGKHNTSYSSDAWKNLFVIYKGDTNVSINPRIQVENTKSKTALIIQDCNRDDSGKYSLALENASGTANTFISIRVLGMYHSGSL